ncbi:hypothetical protein V8E36_000521 [Tilletia maclaganii]
MGPLVSVETARRPRVAGSHNAPAHDMAGCEWVTVFTTDLPPPTQQPDSVIHRLALLQDTIQTLPLPETLQHHRTRPWAATIQTPLETRQIRLFSPEEEKEALNKIARVARWCYNRAVTYLRDHPLCNLT